MNDKELPISEFRNLGYLQEANRLFFHPLGLSMETCRDEQGNEWFGLICDHRSELIGFERDTLNPDKAKFVAEQFKEQSRHRVRAGLWETCQPMPREHEVTLRVQTEVGEIDMVWKGVVETPELLTRALVNSLPVKLTLDGEEVASFHGASVPERPAAVEVKEQFFVGWVKP